MVRAARAAMTAVQEHLASLDTPIEIDGFTLMGGSKRGWTTWLTAADDERVRAIIPAVIPLLNMKPHFEHHREVYGFWAPTLKDYEQRGLLDRIDAADFGRIAHHVDPYLRRESLSLPKYIVNAAGDEFFVPDSDRFYIDDLPGHTSLLVRSGAGHSVTGAQGVAESILAWALTEAMLGVEALPRINVERTDEGIVLATSVPAAGVVLSSMHNAAARDFRVPSVGREWTRVAIETGAEQKFEMVLETPAQGWTAYVAEVTFVTPSGLRLMLSSPLYVVPGTLPFDR
jgi:PhoPQ-activated pathogenicity-related protein